MEKQPLNVLYSFFHRNAMVIAVGLLGIWIAVIAPLGPHLANMPGYLVDSRLINLLLEHFFRWLTGIDKNFWNNTFFYPYPYTTAFSDNFLGSGLFYSFFRAVGMNLQDSFQGWYIIGFILNYAAAAVVLTQLKFRPAAVAAGAFFFTFGLPVFAQEEHAQLLYRFAIPFACLSLWRFFETPKLGHLVKLLFWVVWQLYLSLYTGIFLIFLLAALFITLPFFVPEQTILGLFKFWPKQAKDAFLRAKAREVITNLAGFVLLILATGFLFWPYYQVSKLYGFTRQWGEILTMLPMWRSYLIADKSLIWAPISKLFPDFAMRHEHNLFIGIAAVVVIGIGFFKWKVVQHANVTRVFVVAGALVLLLTFTSQGFSLYGLIASLPGLNSIRAVTRVILILMWPGSLLIASTLDYLLNPANKHRMLLSGLGYLLILGLVVDPIFFKHTTYNKDNAEMRIAALRTKLPAILPNQSILIVANNKTDDAFVTDLDSMLLAQELNLPSLNGYSGNNPPGYGLTYSCRSVPERITAYMDFAHISDNSFYTAMMKRVVPIGFTDCNPNWANKKPTALAGPIPDELIKGLSIKVDSLEKVDGRVTARITVANISALTLPLLSSTSTPFRLSWRLVNIETEQGLSEFDERAEMDADLNPGESQTIIIQGIMPTMPGKYRLDVAAVQEGVTWLYNRGLPVVKSSQLILLSAQNDLTIDATGTVTP